eukprot:scaffold161237_cov22-Tisochrysis_lutea.AAC.2
MHTTADGTGHVRGSNYTLEGPTTPERLDYKRGCQPFSQPLPMRICKDRIVYLELMQCQA